VNKGFGRFAAFGRPSHVVNPSRIVKSQAAGASQHVKSIKLGSGL
jgi:hypothetical protein